MKTTDVLFNIALASFAKRAMVQITPTGEHHVLSPAVTDMAYHRGDPPGLLRSIAGGALPTALAGGLAAHLTGGDPLGVAGLAGALGGLHGGAAHLGRPDPWSFHFSVPRERTAHPERPDSLAGASDELAGILHARPGGHLDQRLQEIRSDLLEDGGHTLKGEKMPLHPEDYDENEKLRPQAARNFKRMERLFPEIAGRPKVSPV